MARDLPILAESSADPAIRELAERAHQNYLYPVDSQVYAPDGELLDHVGTNDLFSKGLTRGYHEFLQEVLK